jgi:hypothetical protein
MLRPRLPRDGLPSSPSALYSSNHLVRFLSAGIMLLADSVAARIKEGMGLRHASLIVKAVSKIPKPHAVSHASG